MQNEMDKMTFNINFRIIWRVRAKLISMSLLQFDIDNFRPFGQLAQIYKIVFDIWYEQTKFNLLFLLQFHVQRNYDAYGKSNLTFGTPI